MISGPERVRLRVLYSGRVQGVFFRATSAQLAEQFSVVGYVRNLSTGQVELEVEGPGHDVEAFLSAVAQRYHGHIDHQERTRLTPLQSEREFEIRY